MRIFVFTYLVIISASLNGQELQQQYLNSLKYEELLTLFNEYDRDSINQEKIARTYLNRARIELDTIKMARGYDRLARIFHPEKNIAFADSVIALTKSMKHITYPAMGYTLKAYYYWVINNLPYATENYLIAMNIAEITGNLQQQVYCMDMLINLKATWGDKREALDLQHIRNKIIQKENYKLELKNSTRNSANIDIDQLYLAELIFSYENYVYCYVQLKNIDSAKYYIDQTFSILGDYHWIDKLEHHTWLSEIELEVSYLEGNFERVILEADSLLDKYYKILSPSSLVNIYLYKGLSLIELKQKESGIYWVQKSDSVYDSGNIIINYDDRMIFEILYGYYASNENPEKQIEYLNKLIKVDSIFKINYQYFDAELIQKYETPKLIEEKEALIAGLTAKNQRSKMANWWIASGLIITLGMLIFYVNQQMIYKKRFKILMAEHSTYDSSQDTSNTYKNDISTEVVDSILKKLDVFESDKGFLSSELSLMTMARDFETNSNYLSRVINLKMEKNFSKYINDLRIDFAVKELRSNPKFRRYTIKAIAMESGFSSTESFRRAFYNRNKIYPSFFIKRLEKSGA